MSTEVSLERNGGLIHAVNGAEDERMRWDNAMNILCSSVNRTIRAVFSMKVYELNNRRISAY